MKHNFINQFQFFPDLALTQDITLTDNNSVGGIKALYIIEHENLGTLTKSAGVASAYSNLATKKFRKYDLPRATAEADQDCITSQENGTSHVVQTIKVALNTVSAAISNELKIMAGLRLACVVVDRNNVGLLFGFENAMTSTTTKAKTGKASGDRNGYEFELVGDENAFAIEIPSSLFTSLITAGV